MQKGNLFNKIYGRPALILQIFFASSIACITTFTANAQSCPYNIDFETGTFDGWTCYIGNVAAVSGENVISIYPSGGPVNNRQTMYSQANRGELDPYGGFPVLCPNGSNHSIRLGNDLAGGEAEGISYDFTIPANKNVYSLIYYYAVVFQDPNHLEFQQPRMEIEITNLTDNTNISCSSFTWIPYGSILPGFFESPNPGGNTPVWCKDWTAVTLNLNGLAGKTIRLFFKTADCTFVRHFGYAYIDVGSECSDEFTGAVYCPGDSTIHVTAPFGFQTYTWYDSSFSNVLGTQQTIQFTPPPAVGTRIAVELVPYNGYGCLDTLYARLVDTLTIKANAGPDVLSCNRTPVQIGEIPKPDLIYSWSPPVGLNDANISNPFATPDATTAYMLTVRNLGGGCIDHDTVIVRAANIDNSLQLIGKAAYCFDSDDSSVLRVNTADSIQWYRNRTAILGATNTTYKATQSGSYSAMLFSNTGCNISTSDQPVYIENPKAGITYPVEYAVKKYPLTLEARNFGASYLWNPIVNLDNPSNESPVFKGITDQLYTIQITTAAGCVTVDTQLVKVIDKVEIYVPSAFTPNGDGRNDFLRPTLMGVKELRYFRIYNRWGQLLYESKTTLPGWNGMIGSIQQPSEVVVWEAEGIGVDGNIYLKKGTSVLIR